MSGKMSFAILEKNEPIFKGIAWAGVDNHLLFSTDLIQGSKNKAIKKLIKEIKKYNENYITENEIKGLSPYMYGLVVIDMDKKQVRSLQNYNNPMEIDLIVFKNGVLKGSDLALKNLIEKDCLTILNKDSNEEYSFIDFFGTLDASNVRSNLFKNKETKFSKVNFPHGLITKYDALDNIVLKPKGLDFTVISYPVNVEGALQMIQDLKNDGVQFTNEEKMHWKSYITESITDITLLKDILENLDNILSIKKKTLKFKK